ncbi:gp674 [Bacillus phage G]|uniref:Gp674 n=1 Tax=Bacillus phage G TaxID=2884420 RepID=G3MB54_9CAUD|nr:gp674 [Bacillus phage G]AEO93917.1 gp674 [Bacillus phage G]
MTLENPKKKRVIEILNNFIVIDSLAATDKTFTLEVYERLAKDCYLWEIRFVENAQEAISFSHNLINIRLKNGRIEVTSNLFLVKSIFKYEFLGYKKSEVGDVPFNRFLYEVTLDSIEELSYLLERVVSKARLEFVLTKF